MLAAFGLSIDLDQQDPRIQKCNKEGENDCRDEPIQASSTRNEHRDTRNHQWQRSRLTQDDTNDELLTKLRLQLAQMVHLQGDDRRPDGESEESVFYTLAPIFLLELGEAGAAPVGRKAEKQVHDSSLPQSMLPLR